MVNPLLPAPDNLISRVSIRLGKLGINLLREAGAKPASRDSARDGVRNINKVTIRDANFPPAVDEFSEEFAGLQMTSLIDLFSKYNQIELDSGCRDFTAFMTPLGLLRQSTLPQSATNCVAQFMLIVVKILTDLIPTVCQPLLDDFCVKGPYS
jgi:hypothetical protein